MEKPRVFISHQKNDSDAARAIADYLQDAGIDVYFDQYDSSINRSDPHSVVSAIKRGIENSSHMLVLFSPNTFGSMCPLIPKTNKLILVSSTNEF